MFSRLKKAEFAFLSEKTFLSLKKVEGVGRSHSFAHLAAVFCVAFFFLCVEVQVPRGRVRDSFNSNLQTGVGFGLSPTPTCRPTMGFGLTPTLTCGPVGVG